MITRRACVRACVCDMGQLYAINANLKASHANLMCVIQVKPSGQYKYHQFSIQQFSVLPTQCIYVFCVVLRTNSHYFPVQH